jgi:hypothetical protein
MPWSFPFANKRPCVLSVAAVGLLFAVGIASAKAPIDRSAAKGDASYIIQVNAFREKKNAEQFLDKLKSKGYTAHLTSSGDKDAPWFKVALGPYSSRDEAHASAEAFNTKENLRAIVVRGQLAVPAAVTPEKKQRPRAASKKAVKKAEHPATPKQITPKKAEEGDAIDVVVSLLLMWKKSWQDRDVDAYLGYYSKNFRPAGRMAYNAWLAERKQALARNQGIQLEFKEIEIQQGKDRVEMSFIQEYRAQDFRDVGIKSLLWKKENGEWKIARETWKKKV